MIEEIKYAIFLILATGIGFVVIAVALGLAVRIVSALVVGL